MNRIYFLVLFISLIRCDNNLQSKDIITRQEKDIILENIKNFPSGTQFSIAIIKNNAVGFLGYQIINDSVIEIDNRDYNVLRSSGSVLSST